MAEKFEFWHDHLGVSVPDPEAAVAWYRDVAGNLIEFIERSRPLSNSASA